VALITIQVLSVTTSSAQDMPLLSLIGKDSHAQSASKSGCMQ
jgi:hypothetical protein